MTIYHSTLVKGGPLQLKVVGDAHKCSWTDKYTHEPVYSVKVEVENESGSEEAYFSADQKVISYLAAFKGQTVTVEAAPNKRITVEGGEPAPSQGKVSTDEVKKRYTGRKSNGEHSAETQGKIQRQAALKVAAAFLAGTTTDLATLFAVTESIEKYINSPTSVAPKKKPTPKPEAQPEEPQPEQETPTGETEPEW